MVPRVLEEPPFTLTQRARSMLMDLMVDGDLIEVVLEETDVIWRLLQASKYRSSPSDRYQDAQVTKN